MGGSSSTEISGVRVFKVSPGSPAAEAGLEVFFDFILEINGIKMDPNGQGQFAKVISESENGQAKLQVFNTRAHTTREVIVNPRKWAGSGLLGATVRYDVVDPAENHGIRVLEVFPNSPAAHAGLVPFQDYLLGTAQRVFHDIDELVEVVNAELNQRIQVYVYNSDHETVREATLMPNQDWGGDGCIGCDIGTGLLHRIPAPRRIPATRPVMPQVPVPGAAAYAPGVLPAPTLPPAAYPPGVQAPPVAYPAAWPPGVAPEYVPTPVPQMPAVPQMPQVPQAFAPPAVAQIPTPAPVGVPPAPMPEVPVQYPAAVPGAVPQYAPAPAVAPMPAPVPTPVVAPQVPTPTPVFVPPAPVAAVPSPVVPSVPAPAVAYTAPAVVAAPAPAPTPAAPVSMSPSEELLALQARIQQLGAGSSVPMSPTTPSPVAQHPITVTPTAASTVGGVTWPPAPVPPTPLAEDIHAQSPSPMGTGQMLLPSESLQSPMTPSASLGSVPPAPPTTPFNPQDAPAPIDFATATMNFSGDPSVASLPQMPQMPSVPTPTPPGASSLL